MNRLKKLSFLFIFSISLFTLPLSTEAASYTVKKGDSLWSIANKFGTTVDNLHMANGRSIHTLYAGETIQVPDTISKTEKERRDKLVHVEAIGEPYAGKVDVAIVVLNWVKHDDFPITIKVVIYEQVSSHYACSPVKDGAINQDYNSEDTKAVNEAIAYGGQG